MDSEPGRGRFEDVGNLLQGSVTGGVAVRDGNVGPHPEDVAAPGKFPMQGRAKDHREATVETGR